MWLRNIKRSAEVVCCRFAPVFRNNEHIVFVGTGREIIEDQIVVNGRADIDGCCVRHIFTALFDDRVAVLDLQDISSAQGDLPAVCGDDTAKTEIAALCQGAGGRYLAADGNGRCLIRCPCGSFHREGTGDRPGVGLGAIFCSDDHAVGVGTDRKVIKDQIVVYRGPDIEGSCIWRIVSVLPTHCITGCIV